LLLFTEKAEVHWEEKFCQINGVHWEKVLETKKYLPQYKDITDWDDSAGKEAFDNAKARFWAQINGLQPETPLPDPDSLIDPIDQDAPLLDHKLYQNLGGSLSEDEGDGSIDCSSDGWGEGGVILWDSHYVKKVEDVVWHNISTGWGEGYPITPTGWGDIPENVQPDTWGVVQTSWADNLVKPTGWGDMAADANPQTTYEGIVPTGWQEAEEVSRGQWNGGVADANYWDYSGNDGNWVRWYQNNGYDYGVSGETGQDWNYSRGNYWNSSQFNAGNWTNYSHNWENCSGEHGYKNSWNRNAAGRAGWTKNVNKNYNKGKQWRKKEDGSRHFCAPLNQPTPSNDG
jgi:hypothetical protein